MLAGSQKRMEQAKKKKDWADETGEKQDGGCLWICRKHSGGRFVLSISFAKVNLVDFLG